MLSWFASIAIPSNRGLLPSPGRQFGNLFGVVTDEIPHGNSEAGVAAAGDHVPRTAKKRPSATQRGRSFSKSPGRGLQTSARTKSDGNGLGRPWVSRKGRVATCRGSRRGEPVWIPIMGCLKANINHPPGSRREKLRRPLHQPCLGRRRIRRSDRLPGWPHGVCRLRGTTQPEPARRAEMQSPPYPAARQPQKATACGAG
jgi:hypothetical protein